MKQPVFEEPRPRVECAFAGCPYDAKVKVKTPTGWANVCLKHDLAIVQKRANEYCEKLGLKTPAECRAWLLKNKAQVKRAPVRERQPGEDEDFKYEAA